MAAICVTQFVKSATVMKTVCDEISSVCEGGRNPLHQLCGWAEPFTGLASSTQRALDVQNQDASQFGFLARTLVLIS